MKKLSFFFAIDWDECVCGCVRFGRNYAFEEIEGIRVCYLLEREKILSVMKVGNFS